ncbi:MAG TPA: hypothetical protein ENJ35_04195 [Gammaproteobacteria bacterium]|nr:hypothetical protein [Gammaproteobacteria bacterium]
MSHDLYEYGSLDPIYFKLTLNGVGVEPGFQDADVKLFHDGVFIDNIGADIGMAAIGGGGTGIYSWTPAAGQTDAGVIIINIKDDSGGGAFDENCLIIATGGHTSARFSG